MNKTIPVGVAITLALLISLGFNILPEDTHFCQELEIGKFCDHLSSTEKTCYPFSSNNTGKKYCSSGWDSIVKYYVDDDTIKSIEPIEVEFNGIWLCESMEPFALCERNGPKGKHQARYYQIKNK